VVGAIFRTNIKMKKINKFIKIMRVTVYRVLSAWSTSETKLLYIGVSSLCVVRI